MDETEMRALPAPEEKASRDETVTVASRLPVSIAISAPPRPEDGSVDALGSTLIVLNGANHPNAAGEVGITEGVSASAFRAWLEARKGHEMASQVWEIQQDEIGKLREVVFGHEAMNAETIPPANAAEKLDSPPPAPSAPMPEDQIPPADRPDDGGDK